MARDTVTSTVTDRDEVIAKLLLKAAEEMPTELLELVCDILDDDMPSTSKAQARLMAAAAHDPKLAKRAGVPVTVAKEFNKADARSGILRKKKSK
jgi:hypothetical protein